MRMPEPFQKVPRPGRGRHERYGPERLGQVERLITQQQGEQILRAHRTLHLLDAPAADQESGPPLTDDLVANAGGILLQIDPLQVGPGAS